MLAAEARRRQGTAAWLSRRLWRNRFNRQEFGVGLQEAVENGPEEQFNGVGVGPSHQRHGRSCRASGP
jgi:hypothetical protein